jgi:hypothetical protein
MKKSFFRVVAAIICVFTAAAFTACFVNDKKTEEIEENDYPSKSSDILAENGNGVTFFKDTSSAKASDILKGTVFEDLPVGDLTVSKFNYVVSDILIKRIIMYIETDLSTAQMLYDSFGDYLTAQNYEAGSENSRAGAVSNYNKTSTPDSYNVSTSYSVSSSILCINANVYPDADAEAVSVIKLTDALPSYLADELTYFGDDYPKCINYSFEFGQGSDIWAHEFWLGRGAVEYDKVLSDLTAALDGWEADKRTATTKFSKEIGDNTVTVTIRNAGTTYFEMRVYAEKTVG